MSRHTHNYRGFTLIELLLVIAIIGILAGIVLVAFNGVRVRARNTYANETVVQYRTAIELYHAKYETYPFVPVPTCIGDRGDNFFCITSEVTTFLSLHPLGDTYYHRLEQAVRQFMPEFPSINKQPINGERLDDLNVQIITGLYTCTNGDASSDTCTNAKLEWVLEGDDQLCSSGGVSSSFQEEVTLCTVEW